MPEITNDSKTVCFVEDDRHTFDVEAGGGSGTPPIEIPATAGNLIEVTCQFMASTPSGGGFTFNLKATASEMKKLSSRGDTTVQTDGAWVTCVRTDYFLAVLPEEQPVDEVAFEAVFGAGSYSEHGQAGALILSAKIVGSIDEHY